MSQHDYIIEDQDGLNFLTDIGNFAMAIVSRNSGASAPSVTYPFMEWQDTSAGLLKARNASNTDWITLGKLAETNGLSKLRGPVAAGGSANAITATLGTVALDETIIFAIECGAATSSTMPTVNIDGLGAKTIVKGSNTALNLADIPGANFVALFRYDSSLDKVQLLNPASTSPDATDTIKGIVELATLAEMQAGTDTTRVPSVDVLRNGLLVPGTPVTTNSGTIWTFNIPAWCKHFVVMLAGFSSSGTSIPIFQLGDSGGPENTGYIGAVDLNGTAAAITSGFRITRSHSAAAVLSGVVEFYELNHASNTWACVGKFANSNAASLSEVAGHKSLSSTLTTVSLTMENGTDTGDAGEINVLCF